MIQLAFIGASGHFGYVLADLERFPQVRTIAHPLLHLTTPMMGLMGPRCKRWKSRLVVGIAERRGL